MLIYPLSDMEENVGFVCRVAEPSGLFPGEIWYFDSFVNGTFQYPGFLLSSLCVRIRSLVYPESSSQLYQRTNLKSQRVQIKSLPRRCQVTDNVTHTRHDTFLFYPLFCLLGSKSTKSQDVTNYFYIEIWKMTNITRSLLYETKTK